MSTKSEVRVEMRCPDCDGTGIDKEKTDAYHKAHPGESGYVACWNCNGNGVDPIKTFQFTTPR